MRPDRSTTTKLRVGSRWSIKLVLGAVRLRVLSGPDEGLTKTLTHPVLCIGTSPGCDLALTDPSVSRRHAELRRHAAGVTLRDLGSTNGTLVRGLQVRECELTEDTEFSLGSTLLGLEHTCEETISPIMDEEGLGGLVGSSAAMRDLYSLLRVAAPSTATILIVGETGTGKERIARALHELSGRSGTMTTFDAATTQPDLLPSRLFGHVKGAFTGADRARKGAFQTARAGTVFLDEIGELPLDVQPNLLRVLENRVVYPVGSDEPVPIDARVVAATHRSLEDMVADGSFRADLYYRLSVVVIRVPPLRERPEDLGLLVDHFRDELGLDLDLTEEALEAMRAHPWPGNVRELRNTLEDLAIRCRGRPVRASDLVWRTVAARLPSPPAPSSSSPRRPPGQLDLDTILAAIERHGGNRTAAARELGISRVTIWRRLTEHGLDP